MNPRIREAKISDLPQVLAIEKESFSTPWSREAFTHEFSGKGKFFWVIEKGDKILGYVCFRIVADEMQVLNLAIKRDYRGKRLAELLLREAFRKARDLGVHVVFLEVREGNLSARCLYQRLGFRIRGRRPHYYQDTGEDALIMELSLTSFP